MAPPIDNNYSFAWIATERSRTNQKSWNLLNRLILIMTWEMRDKKNHHAGFFIIGWFLHLRSTMFNLDLPSRQFMKKRQPTAVVLY